MEKHSCKTCRNADFNQKEELNGRLAGRYRYGCSYRKSGYICGTVASDETLELLCCDGYCGATVITSKKQEQDKLLAELDHRMEVLFDRWLLWKEQGAPGFDATDGKYLNRLRPRCRRIIRPNKSPRISAQNAEIVYTALFTFKFFGKFCAALRLLPHF